MSDLQNQLTDEFGPSISTQPQVLAELTSICKTYSLPAAELFYKYEAHLLSLPPSHPSHPSPSSSGGNIDLEIVKELRKVIMREQQVDRLPLSGVGNSAQGKGSNAKMGVKRMAGDLGGLLDGFNTPSRPSPSQPTATPSSSSYIPNPSSTPYTPTPKPNPSAQSRTAFETPSKAGPGGMKPNGLLGKIGPGIGGDVLGSSPIGYTQQTPFHARTNARERLETLNNHLSPAPVLENHSDRVGRGRVKLGMTRRLGDYEHRYMFEKITDRSAALDEIIEEYADTFRATYGIHELGDPSSISEDPIHVVGRLISTPTDTGRPTASSLQIESSRATGAGKRTPIVFAPDIKVRGAAQGVKGFGVYQGACVALKGRNGGGGDFVVGEVLMPHPSEMVTCRPSALKASQNGPLAELPVSIVVAAGPYSLSNDLDYEPLEALIQQAKIERPNVLMLLGPFIDSAHPKIKLGEVDETPVEMFRSHFGARITSFMESSPTTQVIMMSSVKDMVNRHVAFPQAHLDAERLAELGLPRKVRWLPNPCSIFINDMVFSVSTVDVLFHLRKEEYFRKAEEAEPESSVASGSKDSMAELVRHVLGQKSFYPIFPPPEDLASEVNLDISNQHLLKLETRAPDVLILPSKLKHFAKIIDSVVTINPSNLAKANSGGTYCKMTIHPVPQPDLDKAIDEGDLEDELRVFERTRVDLVRI